MELCCTLADATSENTVPVPLNLAIGQDVGLATCNWLHSSYVYMSLCFVLVYVCLAECV